MPRGVFSLSGTAQPAGPIPIANPDVVGISIRQGWADLEPTEGNFDWTFLDSEVAKATAAGKQILLRIGTQSGKPEWLTAAIQNAGGRFFTFDDSGVQTTIPVFWDPTFLAKKKALIAAVGAHFTNNPTVRIVAASFANASTEDWNVPHAVADVQNWLALGYASALMLDAGKQIIDATMVAFPNQYVALAIASNGHVGGNGINLDPSGTYVADNAIATARTSWPGRLIVQINSLSTFNPVAPGVADSSWNVLWNNQPNVGAQMLDWCYDDSTYRVNAGVIGDPAEVLTKCVDLAATYGIGYIEIYQRDVVALPGVITYARSVLSPTPTPTPTPTPPPPTPTPTSTPPPPTPTPTPTPPPPTPTPTSTPPPPTPTPTPAPPKITSQPASRTLVVGKIATISVTASGAGTLQYQWMKNGVVIQGANKHTYTIPSAQLADNGALFAVTVTDVSGFVRSNNATLTVNPPPAPPSITTQPANITAKAGRTAKFTVTATGTGPLRWQWTKNGANIIGATNASYTTPPTTPADNGARFSVNVSNDVGSVTSHSATLTVQ